MSKARRIVDQAEATLRRDQFGDVGDVVGRVRRREHESRRTDAERLDLGGQRLRVIEDRDVRRASLPNPAFRDAISEDTVKGHVSNILSKLNVNDRTHAVILAIRRGAIQL
jgi:hypothetical protein